jgi:hypothetical protein
MKNSTPIVVFSYNRPESTTRLLSVIKEINPSKLFLICDGPKENNSIDNENNKRVVEIIKSFQIEGEIIYEISKKNLGLGKRIASGLDFVFSLVEDAIILEDDCIPSKSFFPFCSELLEKYKLDTRIMMISGNNYNPEYFKNTNSYIFTKYGHIWGWATWRRAWNLFDYNMTTWPEFYSKNLHKMVFKTTKEQRYFTKIFNLYYSSKKVPWGYRWFYSRISNNSLSIMPTSNLVSNIGAIGTNSDVSKMHYFKSVNDNYQINTHPNFVFEEEAFDTYHFNNHISPRKNHFNKIVKKINNSLNVK